MRLSPAFCAYGKVQRQPCRNQSIACQPQWSAGLPDAWRARVVIPCRFKVYRDFEMPARQVLGFDARDRICFRAYDYRLLDPYSDDDEEFYTLLTYGESSAGWRLKDRGWLLYRRVQSDIEEDHWKEEFRWVADWAKQDDNGDGIKTPAPALMA